MTPATSTGFLFALGAFLMWGLSPFPVHSLNNFPAHEILILRAIIAAPLLSLIFFVRGKLIRIRLNRFTEKSHLIASLLLGINWLLFMTAVNDHKTYEASFGYYLCPLLIVLTSNLIFGERLSSFKWLGVALASVGVLILAEFQDSFPWLGIGVAVSFTIYAVSGKFRSGTALELSLIEFWILALSALCGGLIYFPGAFSSLLIDPIGFLIMGTWTAIPNWLYREAASRINLSQLGFLQYIAPTIQLGVGILFLNETASGTLFLSLTLVWIGLGTFFILPRCFKEN